MLFRLSIFLPVWKKGDNDLKKGLTLTLLIRKSWTKKVSRFSEIYRFNDVGPVSFKMGTPPFSHQKVFSKYKKKQKNSDDWVDPLFSLSILFFLN